MANIRDFKMDVKQMVKHFMQECYVHLAYSPPLHQENVLDIISDAMQLEIDTIKKINKPEQEGKSNLKLYYKAVSNDFYDKIVELTERLNSLSY
ncbi:MAG: hypothetical protein RBT19_00755 [Tenuifilaceae bacterium]|jgi:hypothetical protein|uniref:hypothetical protein n=1 Tax=Perlabentimonas gracilis TaxID=2715279 RepID=UPI00140ABDA6|nr:hypothetical protein [Perlabentimonas gracilis]MDX9768862.1 hypothetical protein [Tenuifilaceae bacterium]NHB68188.1 hypothetical protein [Perlabentimonas gracilis]